MRTDRSEKWTSWRNQILGRCEALTRTSDYLAPVALKGIAESCGVSRVEFRPLLIDGGLAIEDKAFVVFVNCDKATTSDLSKRFSDGGQTLPPRMRFTIAHELIHTFFFEKSNIELKSRIKAIHYKEHESLEQACNFGANLLLVPPGQLAQQLRTTNELTARVIVDLAKKFNVSIQTVLIALNTLRSHESHRFLAALVTSKDKSLLVQASAADPVTRRVFPAAKSGSFLNDVMTIPNLRVFGGCEEQTFYDHPCRTESAPALLPCKATCEATSDARTAYVLVLTVQGPVRAVGTRVADR